MTENLLKATLNQEHTGWDYQSAKNLLRASAIPIDFWEGLITADNRHLKYECLKTKPAKWHVRPAKTQISLGIRPVWSKSVLSAWWKLGSLATHWAACENSDQTGRMPRLILTLRLAHIPLCWFWCEAAHIENNITNPSLLLGELRECWRILPPCWQSRWWYTGG